MQDCGTPEMRASWFWLLMPRHRIRALRRWARDMSAMWIAVMSPQGETVLLQWRSVRESDAGSSSAARLGETMRAQIRPTSYSRHSGTASMNWLTTSG